MLALFVYIPETRELYPRSEILWLLCPLSVYWLGRVTLLATRGTVDDDPVVFAMRDRTSWLVGLAGLGVLAAAS